jgi:uncharacterized membrane protein YfcA
MGARLLGRARTRVLRSLFAVVIGVMALEMVYSGVTGGMR